MKIANRLLTSYGVYGIFRLTFNWLVTKLFYPRARLIRLPIYIRGQSAISWGNDFTTGVGVRLDAFGDGKEKLLIIGDRVQINDYVHIGVIERVSIGNDVLIASKVFISDHNHGSYNKKDSQSNPNIPPSKRPLFSSPIIIEDRVWIGESVSIMPGVRIGEGAIVGAGAVVTSDLPANTISVGIPARVIKYFCDDQNAWLPIHKD